MDKEKEELFNKAQELTVENKASCNNYFIHYLFYDKLKTRNIECWCSGCNEHYIVGQERTMEAKDYEYLTMSHNGKGKCKKCGRDIIFKNLGKAKGRKNLWEENYLIIVQPLNYNEVMLRAFYVTKNYSEKLLPEIYLSETERFYLTPGNAIRWKWQGTYTSTGYMFQPFEVKKIGEPFNSNTHGYFHSYSNKDHSHYIINQFELDNTFLKYSQLKLYQQNIDVIYETQYEIKYLCFYAQYPAAEMMLKIEGLNNFVESAVRFDKPCKRLLNWNGKTPQEIFKMTKAEFNELRSIKSPDKTEALKMYKKSGNEFSLTLIAEFQTSYSYEIEKYFDMTVKFNLKKLTLHTYFKKHANRNKFSIDRVWRTWLDYINYAEKLHYDLNSPVVLLPKSLYAKHDEAVRTYNAIQNEIRSKKEKREKLIKEKKHQSLYADRVKKYEYSDGEYMIIVPPTLQSIVDEGKALEHCVGGYTDRHAEGYLTILFMRSCTEPNKSLYTIEMTNNGKIRQAYGFKNKSTPPKEFTDIYLSVVYKRDKKKSKKEKAPAQPVAV